MYGSYGSFKRLGLSTTSHMEPRMSKGEWMSAYGTSNNIRRPTSQSPTQPTSPQSNRLQRSESNSAAVSAMVAAARAIRQRNSATSNASPQRPQQISRHPGNNSDIDEAAEYATDDDIDEDDEIKSESGIEKQARADRRLQQMRKKHKSDKDKLKKKKEKTKRTKTLRRTTSDVEIDISTPPSSSSPVNVSLSLPSLGDSVVSDVRERTRLLLREALIKTDPEMKDKVKMEEEKKKLKTEEAKGSTKKKRKREEEESKDSRNTKVEEEKDDNDHIDDEDDQHTLLASDIEQSLYEHHQFTPSTAYRQHSRNLIFSLINNPSLTLSLLSTQLSPISFVTLPSSSLASSSIKAIRDNEQKEVLRDMVLGGNEGVISDEYVCSGCGNRETEFWILKEARDLRKVEVWGGGGDDASTVILIRCRNCKKEWKKEV